MSIRRRAPVPTANAWIVMASDPGEIVEWLAEQAPDTLDQRATVIPLKQDIDLADQGVQAFAANGNLHSGLGRSGTPGGPVLAYYPDIKLLADAVALADGQPLGVIEFHAGEVAGWAAATNAINLDTGQPTPSVPAEIPVPGEANGGRLRRLS
jgi:hypothetical protein